MREQLGAAGGGPAGWPLAERASGAVSGVLSSLLGVATSLAGALANLVLVLVLVGGVFLAGQPGLYRCGLLALVPEAGAGREHVGATLDDCGPALRLWLLGRLAAMAAVGVIGLGLWLIGVPAPLALALLVFLAEFVPYVGPVAAAVPALLLALAQGPGAALWTAALYLGVQQVKGNLLTPLIQRQTLELPPALTLLAVVAAGVVLGPLGLVSGALGKATGEPGEPGEPAGASHSSP